MVLRRGGCVIDLEAELELKPIPSSIDSAIKKHKRYAYIVQKANEIVKNYGYAVVLSEEMTFEDVIQKQRALITIDTKGTFPGIRILEKLCNEIAEATGISVKQIGFCLFSQQQAE